MVGVGIVGLGFGTAVHMPAWRLDGRARVIGVCGQGRERSQQSATEFGVEAVDFAQMLHRDDIQILSLAVPPRYQPALIEAAARAGKHVFCEKPVGASLPEAQRAYEVVQQSSIRHGIDLIFPEISAWKAAKDCLSRLGRPRHLHLSWLLESRAFRSHQPSWKTSLSEGGGAIGNFASHSVYYLEWLLGPIHKILAWSTSDNAFQGHAELLLELGDGVQASLSIAADALLGSGHRLELYADNGALRLLNNSGDFARGFSLQEAVRQDGVWRNVVTPEAGEGDGRIVPVARLVSRLLDSLETNLEMTPGLREGLRIQRLLEAAGRSLSEERWIVVEDE